MLVYTKKELGTETASIVVVSLQDIKTVKGRNLSVSTATRGIFNEHRQLGLVVKVFGF